MKVQQFLQHHGVAENPFGQEDAQTDHVFQQHCLEGTHHPAWDKIYSNPGNPATSVVFGEKGAGKTALRLQIVKQLKQYNTENPDEKTLVIEYDDFNPFLDSFRDRLHGRKRKSERMLSYWRLWDHMDAILSLGVTQLVSALLNPNGVNKLKIAPERLEKMNRLEKRDLLLLTACYDHTFDQSKYERWSSLRKKLGFSTWKNQADFALAIATTWALIGALVYWGLPQNKYMWGLFVLILGAGWWPWKWRQMRLTWSALKVAKQIRVFDHLPMTMRRVLSKFSRSDIFGQPLPTKDRSDDRYELILKFQSVIARLGFKNIIVLVDRVDEPHLINGSPERMRDLLWPMFDNKFLKHPGMGFKLLLPAEVVYFLNREEKTFYERSRLDKQNLIMSLNWTGESMFDVANDRVRACADPNDSTAANTLNVKDWFDDQITEEELIGIFGRLRVPRHLFKFLYRLLVEHCNRHTEANPVWKISRETLQASLALFMRDLESFDRGMGTG